MEFMHQMTKEDDSVNKMAQIKRMDDIYGNAAFTIVNAGHQCSLSADSPLSGVRPDTRKVFQFTARADSFSVMANACPRLQEDLDLSKWHSRAWTFREEHMSRALLIFTGSQCFFQAGKRLFCEDMIFEADQEGTALIPLTFSTLQSYHCKVDADFTSEFNLEDYCFIIKSYVKRDLTFDEDAIKAVLGMLRRFSVKLDGRDSRLIFGHPSAAFDYPLCWTSDCFYPNTRRSSFPSWSWVARKQHVGFDLGHRCNKQYTLASRGPLATSLYTDALGDGRFTLNNLLDE
jgi:heterokaryon incompatibility protein (HET)